MFKELRPALLMMLWLSVLTGVLYPLAVTGIGQLLFPEQANGSLILRDGKVIGSQLIGQPFDDPRYFWGRLSATTPFPYNAAASTGSNYGPLNPALITAAKVRTASLAAAGPIPVDLLTASASGLDPGLSPAGALYQVPRVAQARGVDEERVRALVLAAIEPRSLGFLGEPTVNILRLNLALDGAK